MNSIIIRLALGNGDITFTTDRAEYQRLYKSGAHIIFAVEYPSAEMATREIAHY